MKKRFSDEQIISILHEAEAGVSARELCRKHAISNSRQYGDHFTLTTNLSDTNCLEIQGASLSAICCLSYFYLQKLSVETL